MIQRPWALWRRVQYATGFSLLFALVTMLLYVVYWQKEPTCFDNKQNGDERGLDCGGGCARVCSFDIIPPQVLWTESFKITDGQYNAVSYIENRNKTIGSPALSYTLTLYDAQGIIVERKGSSVLPPDGVYPIFEGRIMTGDRVPTRSEIVFDGDIDWRAGGVGRKQFALESRELAQVDSKPRLNAQLRNTSLDEARDVEIVATIFDVHGNALTAARTVVEYFEGRRTTDVVFTWPLPIAKTLRSCEIPTDVILGIDLSGSMNNDGGNPPEPITGTLTAAKEFVSQLRDTDQVGIVTYASNATVTTPLTSDIARAAAIVQGLSIDPKEERGNTNTGEALVKIQEEMESSRHSDDARKVVVLLTDGLATAPEKDPELFAQKSADALKAMDVDLFTIGLGANLNEDALRNLASESSYYYKAPTTRELGSIYTSITESICEDGPAVIEIIAKPRF